MNFKQAYQDLVMTNYFLFKYNLKSLEIETNFDMPN
jgi:hypothetical protein